MRRSIPFTAALRKRNPAENQAALGVVDAYTFSNPVFAVYVPWYYQIRGTNLDTAILAALVQSGVPAFLPGSGTLAPQESPQGDPGWNVTLLTSDSHTSFRAGSSACGPGLSVFAGVSL